MSDSIPVVYNNSTFGDILSADDNGYSGWQLDYVEQSQNDEFGRLSSRRQYGTVCTFQLVAKALGDSIKIDIDNDHFNNRFGRYGVLDEGTFFYERFETRGNYSWNMYSRNYICWSQYRLDTPEGETHWPVNDDHFNREASSSHAFYGDFLPEYHRWLCDKFRREGKLGSLRGYVNCSLNGGPRRELVDRGVDICSAPNYDVKVQREALKK